MAKRDNATVEVKDVVTIKVQHYTTLRQVNLSVTQLIKYSVFLVL